MSEQKSSEENNRDKTPLTEAQLAELKRRIAAYKANPENVIPWEQIKAEALARCQKQ